MNSITNQEIKIITQIKTTKEDFKKQDNNNFSFRVKPFSYEGQEIKALEVRQGNKENYEEFMNFSSRDWIDFCKNANFTGKSDPRLDLIWMKNKVEIDLTAEKIIERN